MTEKLKPCPFCGSDQHPIVIAWEDADWVDHYGVDYGFLVVCSAATNRALETNGCGASSCWSETKKKAIAAWNTRAYHSAIDAAKRYAAQDDALWRWVAAVLREEHRRQQYAEEMFPQANSEIKHSRRALLDAAVSCEFRAGRIPITPAPPRLVPVRKETEMVHVKKHLNLGPRVEHDG